MEHLLGRSADDGASPTTLSLISYAGAAATKLVSILAMWLEQLSSASLGLLVGSLALSAGLTWRWHSGRLRQETMPRATLLLLGSLLGISALILAQQQRTLDMLTATTSIVSASGSIFTVPASANDGQPVIPNILDPEAVNPQSVCPGYRAVDVAETVDGLTADLVLAGEPCNVYGTDIQALRLLVEYQAADRLHVEIQPKYIGWENSSWFVLPEELIPKPGVDEGAAEGGFAPESDIEFSWGNDPSFWFSIARKSTGDVLFTTENTQIVYEDQFIEFGSALPENYNLYGLGEVIHGLRLGTNFTST